jgi:hypothetical protein
MLEDKEEENDEPKPAALFRRRPTAMMVKSCANGEEMSQC